MSIMKSRSRRAVTSASAFSWRAIASTLVGEGADSLIFFPLALGGVIPWDVMPWVMLNQVVLKTLYEILVLPLTIRVVRILKRVERTDTIDSGISYNPFRL